MSVDRRTRAVVVLEDDHRSEVFLTLQALEDIDEAREGGKRELLEGVRGSIQLDFNKKGRVVRISVMGYKFEDVELFRT